MFKVHLVYQAIKKTINCSLWAITNLPHVLGFFPCTSSTPRLKIFGPLPANIFLPGCEPKTSISSRWGPIEHNMARELRPPWGIYIQRCPCMSALWEWFYVLGVCTVDRCLSAGCLNSRPHPDTPRGRGTQGVSH